MKLKLIHTIRNILVIIILFDIFITFSCSENTMKDDYHILIPGVGYDNFQLGKTTLKDIENLNGKDYILDTFYRKSIKDTTNKTQGEIYSIGACYDSLGVRYFFFPGDSVIFSIIMRPPFKCKTKEGIKLNESTFNDIIKCYGDTVWGFAKGRMTKSYEGIWFTQSTNCTYESSDLEKEACLSNKVVEISIVGFD
jgi:hypothetical protein